MAEEARIELERAAEAIRQADALLITAGAGMGVDSGLPDFRGKEGFWRAYPPLREMKVALDGVSNPKWFDENPKFAWGFFGHRYSLYKNSTPHQGFSLLKRWGEAMEHGSFVYTSNVDGHFQRAGFSSDRIVECHGTIHYMQLVDPSIDDCIWPVPDDYNFQVDEKTLHMTTPLPVGPPGGEVQYPARPCIKMFHDTTWVPTRKDAEMKTFETFLDDIGICEPNGSKFVLIEIGSGLAVPAVRSMGSSIVEKSGNKGTMIRINPNEPEVPEGRHIGLKMKAMEALINIEHILNV